MADIITRLKDIYDKYTALSQKLSDSAVIADTAEWSKLAKEQAEQELIQREDVQALLAGKTVTKVIFVPGRLLNIVAK